MKSTFRKFERIYYVIRPKTARVACYVAGISCIAAMLRATQPFILSTAALAAINHPSTLATIGSVYLAVGVSIGVLVAVANYFSLQSREYIGADIALAALSAMLHPEKSFWRYSITDLLHAYTKGRETAHALVTDLLADLLPYFAGLLVSIAIVAIKINPLTAMAVCISSAGFFLITALNIRTERALSVKIVSASKEITASVASAHELSEIVRSFRTESYLRSNLQHQLSDFNKIVKRHGRHYLKKHILLDVTRWAGLLFTVAMYFFAKADASDLRPHDFGALIALVLIYFQLIEPVVALARAGERLIQATASLDTISSVLRDAVSNESAVVSKQAAVFHASNGMMLVGIRTGFEQRSMGQCHNEQWHRGDVVIWEGPSGIGKSTLARTIAGLIPGREGYVSFARDDESRNINIATDYAQCRQYVLYVPQADYVFAGSVIDNIRLGDETITDDAIFRAVQQLGIAKILAIRGMSLYDRINDRGGDWSGGERKRIALARAFARRPGVLILDEPTAHLDIVSGRSVIDAFREQFKDALLILISHEPLARPQDKKISWYGASGDTTSSPDTY